MLLSITTTHRPATDLGFLLHKNPSNVRTVEFPFGPAHVFYPEASEERCTATVMLEMDPVGLVRNRKGPAGEGFALAHYVNDRPYVASSFMSVALAKLFGTAMAGRSKDRPDLAEQALPLEVSVPVLPCRGGEPILRRLFEPLGYEVQTTPIPLDDRFPAWGTSRYVMATLRARARVADVLAHLYVLLPVLDDDKHYWVAEDEVEKLLARGGTWLADHPERDLIVRRYLRHQKRLTTAALERLLEEDQPDPDADEEAHDREEEVVEERLSLHTQRIGAVMSVLKSMGARRVVDLGCGAGRLIRELLADPQFLEVGGVDVSHQALAAAARTLRLDRMPERQRDRVTLFQSSLTYRDRRLSGYDAATLLEVIEHVEPSRLAAMERTVFGSAQPGSVVVTTPNAEYNVRFETLPAGEMRHRDHRFEWTRTEFADWSRSVGEQYGYAVRFLPIGAEDPEVGPPTQMAVFSR
ncbi:MAG: 3' terminal RNA ribose 2'-O-methyltransferase Hen1 [Acidimicrobiales bacterium]